MFTNAPLKPEQLQVLRTTQTNMINRLLAAVRPMRDRDARRGIGLSIGVYGTIFELRKVLTNYGGSGHHMAHAVGMIEGAIAMLRAVPCNSLIEETRLMEALALARDVGMTDSAVYAEARMDDLKAVEHAFSLIEVDA